ncbi:MAG: AAA domain-containing protein [Rickettsiales bacterium]
MRHKPVRELIGEMGEALTSLTPCLLMSLLSVSQFLPAEGRLFDLVVFDEASQIAVWDGVGAVARGKNVIVVGDPKQMPPTNFFSRAADGDDSDDESGHSDDLESILDEALAAGMKPNRLLQPSLL